MFMGVYALTLLFLSTVVNVDKIMLLG